MPKRICTLLSTMALAALLSPSGAGAAVQIRNGLYKGTNVASWSFLRRECRIDVFRDKGSLVLVTITAEGSTYNLWMGGEELRSEVNGLSGWRQSDPIGLESLNRLTETRVFSTRKPATGEGYSLAVKEGERSKPVSFEFVHFDSAGTQKHILCRRIKELPNN